MNVAFEETGPSPEGNLREEINTDTKNIPLHVLLPRNPTWAWLLETGRSFLGGYQLALGDPLNPRGTPCAKFIFSCISETLRLPCSIGAMAPSVGQQSKSEPQSSHLLSRRHIPAWAGLRKQCNGAPERPGCGQPPGWAPVPTLCSSPPRRAPSSVRSPGLLPAHSPLPWALAAPPSHPVSASGISHWPPASTPKVQPHPL